MQCEYKSFFLVVPLPSVRWLWQNTYIYIFFFLALLLVNDTEEVGPLQTVDISKPETTTWILRDLEPLSKYKFYLCSCTTVGCGPDVSDECTTTLETSEWLKVRKAEPIGLCVSG